MPLFPVATVLILLVTGSDSTFPLVDCETKETVIVFQVDCQHLVHEQSQFINQLEHFLRTEKHWKIVKVLYVIAGVNNETAWEKEILLNSSSLLAETVMEECLRDMFSSSFGSVRFFSNKYRLMFIILVSRKAWINETFIEDMMEINRKSRHKIFVITDIDESANFIYQTDSYRNLDVHEVYQQMCDSRCRQTSLTCTFNDFFKSFYHVKQSPHATYESGLDYCSVKYKSYLLSIETFAELDFVLSMLRKQHNSPEKTYKILLGYNKNKWESGNPFLWFEPIPSTCLYLILNTSSTQANENFFQFYNCSDTLTDVYIVCECHEFLESNKYNRINYFKHSDKYNSAFSVDLSDYKRYGRNFTIDTNNCSVYSDSIVNKFVCEKTKSKREKSNDEPDNKIHIICLKHQICHDIEITQFEPIDQLLNNETDSLVDSLKSSVESLNAVCSLQMENLTQLNLFKNSWYYDIHRGSQFNNRSMTFKIEKYREKFFSCPQNYYQCFDNSCVDFVKLDDGENDCPLGDDELFYEHFSPPCKGFVTMKSKEMSYQSHCPYSNVTKNEYLTSKVKQTNELHETVSIEVTESVVYFTNVSHALVHVHPELLSYLPIVDILQIEITGCEITDFETSFKHWDTSTLVSLNLKRNLLTNIDFLVNMSELRHIDLSYNEHLTIGDEFQFPAFLEFIDLSYTNIHSIPSRAFSRLQELTFLNVSNTKICRFEDMKIPSNFRLHTLNIRGLFMVDLHANYFQDLIIDSQILADDYRLCCPIVLGVNIDQDKCIAPSDVISSCQHLVGDTFKRITFWIVGLITLAGNGAVVAYRVKWGQWTFTKAYDIFVTGLAMSDFLMGVYLITIACVDVHYRDLYVLKHVEWKQGNLCSFSGFLSTLSSEMSTFFICLITIDRFLVITFPFGENKFSKIVIKLTLMFVWLSGCTLALIPAVYPGWEIYSSNGLCLPLPLSTQRFTGWQYSVAIFVFLNFILFLIIAFGQMAIFISVTRSKGSLICKQNNPQARLQDIAVAKKLAFVALSDFLCWFPIGILGMFTLNGFEFNPEVYAWMAVFVMPVNSALKPFIYTIPAIYNRFRN